MCPVLEEKISETSLLLLVFLELEEIGEMKQGTNLIQESPQKSYIIYI